MSKLIHENQWIWIVVQDPGVNEHFLGQHDKDNDVSFIPAFLKKEDALQNIYRLALDKSRKYEAQAILYEELVTHCADNGFALFILNETGHVLEKIKPKD